MAAIKNAYSEAPPAKTMGEIQATLAENGAHRVQIDYNGDREPVAISFAMDVGENEMLFRLTVNPEGLLQAMREDKNTPNSQCNLAQAKRTAWKNKLEWLQIQLAEVKTNQAEIQELLLGSAVTNDDQTLYERIKTEQNLLTN